MSDTADRPAPRVCKTSGIRILKEGPLPNAQRRQTLRLAAHGAVLPTAFFMLDAVAGSPPAGTPPMAAAVAPAPMPGRIVRDFNDPWIEVLRLLHEAAEVEHALMLQYLYAAFSVKPQYRKIVGFGGPGANDLLGVAIQEMQHLGKLNQLLVALGAAPKLIREDFPYEPEIYPFRFNLEPLSRGSLAKYVWTESPPGATDVRNAKTAEDRVFCREIEQALGPDTRPNYIGSLYAALISAVQELAATGEAGLPDLGPWVVALQAIKDEGEVDHFMFFKRLFTGVHEGFEGRSNVWNRPASDPLYPSYKLPTNPTAYVGHENQIQDPHLQSLAWLGNLHYWILLALLSAGYSTGSHEHIGLARLHMMGPFWALARELSAAGSGMPFDPLSIGYAPGVTRQANARLLARLLAEADRFEKRLVAVLPGDFPPNCCSVTLTSLNQLEPRTKVASAPLQPWDDGLA